MKRYAVFYNNGVTEGLKDPTNDDETQENVQIMSGRLENNLKQLEASGRLNDLIVHNRYRSIGVMSLSGPEDKIEELDIFLKQTNLGSVEIGDEPIFKTAVTSD